MLSVFRPTAPIQWSWVSLIGPDARDFLHRLTTVNVQALEPGQGAPGFFLTPQGKLKAFFTLWCYRPDEYAFELDGGATGSWKTELLKTIDFYTFAEKITVADVTQLESRWIFADDPVELAELGAGVPKPFSTVAMEDEIRLGFHGVNAYGRAWVTAWGRGPRLDQWLERTLPGARTASFDEVEKWRIQSLRPRVDLELSEAVNPLEVGLREGIADNKGCYPGQEVIEKIISLGSPARRLARVDGEGAKPAAGTKLFNEATPPAEVGEITSAVESAPGRFEALALVRKIHATVGLKVRVGSETGRAEIVRVAPYA